MSNVDIFATTKEKTIPGWAKFTNPGDSFQGTYIGKIVGLIDGYGNEQIVYQLLQADDTVINVGFGLNKKVIHADMQQVKFGQIIGFRYKGKIQVKDKFGKPVEVKDFGFHQDPKIVNEKWLKENAGNMPKTIQATNAASAEKSQEELKADADFDKMGKPAGVEDPTENDVPFDSEGSKTNETKLKEIEALAQAKLGVTDSKMTKEKVMEALGVAFIPVNYDTILAKLASL